MTLQLLPENENDRKMLAAWLDAPGELHTISQEWNTGGVNGIHELSLGWYRSVPWYERIFWRVWKWLEGAK